MKLKYLFSAILSSAILLAGCQKEDSAESLDNISLSKTYLSIPETGGSVEMTITATEDWKFVINENWPDVVTFNKDENGKTIKATHDRFGNLINDEADIASRTPSWLTSSVLEGKAGETKVTFSAEATSGGREIELAIIAGSNKQFLNVRQGSMEAVTATCQEVIDGADGKTYRVKGVCTAIANTTYGNWYLADETGEIYIYGTLDEDGQEQNFSSWNLEVGDEIEVEGPKTTYNTTIELVNVTVISLTKSLVKIVSEEQTLPKEGGEFEVKVAYKGDGVFPSVPESYRSWVSIVDMQNKAGEATKIEPNPADTAIVKINLAANEAGDRTGAVSFTSTSGRSSSSVTYNFTQEGSIIDATVAEFIAAEVGATQYRVSGTIVELSVSEQYQNADITISDALGTELLLFRMTPPEGTRIEELGLAVGDKLTAVGQRGEYKGSPQMVSGKYESHVHYEAVTVSEFIAAEESSTLYSVSGTITDVKDLSDSYNNVGVTITDGENSVLLYRMTTYDGTKVSTLNLEIGGTITVAGRRSSYNGSPQMAAGGICLIYTAPSAE